jgi:hypothetical protein
LLSVSLKNGLETTINCVVNQWYVNAFGYKGYLFNTTIESITSCYGV